MSEAVHLVKGAGLAYNDTQTYWEARGLPDNADYSAHEDCVMWHHWSGVSTQLAVDIAALEEGRPIMKVDQAATHPSGPRRVAEAQAEVYVLAFQALSCEAQELVRERIMQVEDVPPELAVELESWRVAASEALSQFEEMLGETK